MKDGRVTPKVAVIKNELHPERTTVNVYVKYKDPSSVDQVCVFVIKNIALTTLNILLS